MDPNYITFCLSLKTGNKPAHIKNILYSVAERTEQNVNYKITSRILGMRATT